MLVLYLSPADNKKITVCPTRGQSKVRQEVLFALWKRGQQEETQSAGQADEQTSDPDGAWRDVIEFLWHLLSN